MGVLLNAMVMILFYQLYDVFLQVSTCSTIENEPYIIRIFIMQ